MMSKKIKLKKGEVFKKIEGYGDRYYISNMGRLWSNVSGNFLGAKDKDGYIKVGIRNEDGELESTLMHRLVGKAFVPNDDPENKTEINHKNYKRDDNRAENLEWVTRQENVDYSYERISNSARETFNKLWEDEDFKKKKAEDLKKQWEDEDFRKKHVERLKKQWEDEDFREKKVEEVRKLWKDEDFRKKMKEATNKLWEDEDFRKKQSNLMKEKNQNTNFQAKRLEGLRKATCKPILQYTEEGELVSKFSSQAEAAEKTEICRSSISAALRGKTKTAGGFKWEYDQ